MSLKNGRSRMANPAGGFRSCKSTFFIRGERGRGVAKRLFQQSHLEPTNLPTYEGVLAARLMRLPLPEKLTIATDAVPVAHTGLSNLVMRRAFTIGRLVGPLMFPAHSGGSLPLKKDHPERANDLNHLSPSELSARAWGELAFVRAPMHNPYPPSRGSGLKISSRRWLAGIRARTVCSPNIALLYKDPAQPGLLYTHTTQSHRVRGQAPGHRARKR